MTGSTLAATEFLDHESPEVREFVAAALSRAGDPATPVERAVALYYAVRDGIAYEVYGTDLSRAGLRASAVVRAGKGFCMHKSVLYAAAVRAVGVPSRIRYADVRNHLASPRLRELAGGDVFFHSFTAVRPESRWVTATPVFNGLLCRLYRMRPLEFDGRADSHYHPFDAGGDQHMEFLADRGEYDDVPYDLVITTMRAAHPRLLDEAHASTGSLRDEAPTD